MALSIGRKEEESVTITLKPDISADEIKQLIEHGFSVQVRRTGRDKIVLSVDAPSCVSVARTELIEQT